MKTIIVSVMAKRIGGTTYLLRDVVCAHFHLAY
jgi:hypothetical protein